MTILWFLKVKTSNSKIKLVKYVPVFHTDGRLTELLLGDLVGNVCSHEDSHGDAQFPSDDLRDQLQTVWTCVDTLEPATGHDHKKITQTHENFRASEVCILQFPLHTVKSCTHHSIQAVKTITHCNMSASSLYLSIINHINWPYYCTVCVQESQALMSILHTRGSGHWIQTNLNGKNIKWQRNTRVPANCRH